MQRLLGSLVLVFLSADRNLTFFPASKDSETRKRRRRGEDSNLMKRGEKERDHARDADKTRKEAAEVVGWRSE